VGEAVQEHSRQFRVIINAFVTNGKEVVIHTHRTLHWQFTDHPSK